MSRYTKGIDISEHNGVIDWEKVKASGVQFVMIRAGFGQTIDPKFKRNISECNRVGLACGVYWFSYAINAAGAKLEAMTCLDAVKPFKINLPIAFDLEYDSVKYAQKQGVLISTSIASEMAKAFCQTIQDAGYTALNYANPDYLNRYFDKTGTGQFPVWLAQWPGGTPDLDKPPRPCAIWQHSDKGRVPGINGPVDLDVCYVPLEQENLENKEEETDMNSYKYLEDVPEYYKEAVEKAIRGGGLKGTGNNELDLSEDICRMLTILDRMGKLD